MTLNFLHLILCLCQGGQADATVLNLVISSEVEGGQIHLSVVSLPLF